MFAFSPFILQEAEQKLKHNHGTATILQTFSGLNQNMYNVS
jgi:hypothetical protein